MKSIFTSAVVALLAVSASAQVVVNNTGNDTISPVNGTDNGTIIVPPVIIDNTSNATNGTSGNNGTDNGTVIPPVIGEGNNGTDNGTAVDNSTSGSNGTDNGTIIDNGNSTDNGTGIIPGNGDAPGSGAAAVVLDPNALVPCVATNGTQCAFVFGSEFCCLQASGNQISDNSVFNQQFCYNQTLLSEQRASGIQYGNDVTLSTLACLNSGYIIQLTGAAIAVGAATLLF